MSKNGVKKMVSGLIRRGGCIEYVIVGRHLHVTRSQGRKLSETVYDAALEPVATTTHDPVCYFQKEWELH